MPDLRREEIEAIRDATLSMDQLIREHIHASFTYRFVQSDSYAEAMAIENAVKSGALGQAPGSIHTADLEYACGSRFGRRT